MFNCRQPIWMRFTWLSPILAVMAYVIFAARTVPAPVSRVLTGPFKLIVANLQVAPLTKEEVAARVDYDTTVTATVDHQGPTPNWWGSASSSENLRCDYGQDPHLINERGNRLSLYFKPRRQYFSPFPSGAWYYSKSRRSYIVIYRIYTGYVPADVKRITFKTQIALQGHRLPIAVVVRGKQ